MQYQIKVNTPEGKARWAAKKLDIPILGIISKIKLDTYINEEESQFIWVVNSSAKDYLRIRNNVNKFQVMSTSLISQGSVKKMIKRKADSPEDYKDLLKLFKNGINLKINSVTDEEIKEMNEGGLFSKLFKSSPFKKSAVNHK